MFLSGYHTSIAPLCLVSSWSNSAQRNRDQEKNRGGTADASDDHGVDDPEDGETDEDEVEARKAAEFFEDGDMDEAVPGGDGFAGSAGVPFQQLNLSRPLLRAVEAMGFVSPTPIQQRAVPFALAGRWVAFVC